MSKNCTHNLQSNQGHGQRNEMKTPKRETAEPRPAMDAVNDILTDLEKQMDKDFMETGKAVAELFRAVCTAAIKLPNMELHTELMCLTNDENGLAVFFNRDTADEGEHHLHDDFDDAFDGYDDEEEEMLYDGD